MLGLVAQTHCGWGLNRYFVAIRRSSMVQERREHENDWEANTTCDHPGCWAITGWPPFLLPPVFSEASFIARYSVPGSNTMLGLGLIRDSKLLPVESVDWGTVFACTPKCVTEPWGGKRAICTTMKTALLYSKHSIELHSLRDFCLTYNQPYWLNAIMLKLEVQSRRWNLVKPSRASPCCAVA